MKPDGVRYKQITLATKGCDDSVGSRITPLCSEVKSCWSEIISWRQFAVEVSSKSKGPSCTFRPASEMEGDTSYFSTHTPCAAALLPQIWHIAYSALQSLHTATEAGWKAALVLLFLRQWSLPRLLPVEDVILHKCWYNSKRRFSLTILGVVVFKVSTLLKITLLMCPRGIYWHERLVLT